jgi:UDP:flavonoid glycosyltransferase YjiC (YdhE family)
MLPKPNPTYSPPEWWSNLSSGWPVIMITQGTVEMNWKDFVIHAIEGPMCEDVVMVAAPFNKQAIEIMPKNLRTKKFIPFDQLLLWM